MLVELSMLVAAGLACSTLAMPWSRAEAAPVEPTPVVGASTQERGSARLLPVDGTWLTGRTAVWTSGSESAPCFPPSSDVVPRRERPVSSGPLAFLLGSTVFAQTYH